MAALSPDPAVGTDIHARREALERGLRRANAASVLILVLLVALAFGFVWKARQSAREAERASGQATRANAEANRARQATARAEEELWKARLNEARARRIAGGPGARTEAAAILRELVRRPDLAEEQRLALRQEAIAQLALVDVEPPAGDAPQKDHWRLREWDGSLTRYLHHTAASAVEVREYPSERVVASFRHPSNAVPRVSVLTPDGRFVAARFSGSDVLVWNVESGNLFLKSRCQPSADTARPLMTSPDSRTLAMFTHQGLVLQPLESNAVARPLQPGRIVVNMIFTHDMKRMAVSIAGADNIVEVWDVGTGGTLQRIDAGFQVWTFEWHPDGRRLAVSGATGRLAIWDMAPTLVDVVSSNRSPALRASAPREMIQLEGHAGAVDYTMFAPDGSCLLTHAYDRTSILWDVTSGKRLLAETRVTLQGFDTTGEKMVGLSSNGWCEGICAFRSRTGFRTVASVGKPRPINGVWLSPDSRLLLLVHPASLDYPNGECRLWDFARGTEIARLPGIWGQFSPDGRALYTFEIETLCKRELPANAVDWPPGEVILKMDRGDSANAGTITSDGRRLALGAVNHVMLVDLERKTVLRKFAAPAHDAELSPDGGLLGTRFHNQPGRLRNPTNGAVLAQPEDVVEFVFSPDNKWVLARGTDKLRLLDPKSLAVVREIRLELGAGFPPSTAFTSDGAMLAVVHNRFDVSLHELASGRVLATFSPPHPAQGAWSHGLTFSSDNRWLVLAKQDGDIVAWDLPIVRAELAKLGLDWSSAESLLNRDRDLAPALTSSSQSGSRITSAIKDAEAGRVEIARNAPSSTGVLGSPAVTVAFGAVALALAAGLFVSLHQRRMLTAYARAEALTFEQQVKLQTAQEELQHSQKMRALGTLAAGIAHDFNNLLSVIRLSNQLAAEQTKPSGSAKENVDAIESAVAQGETIVQSMLGYSRAAAELENDYCVAAAVSETVAMLGRKFLSGIVLQLEVQPDIPAVRGVRGRLEQMLLNLVVNASEAMSGKGTLRLSARVVAHPANCILKPKPARRYVAVSVGDSGPGIPAEILPRVFEPFFTTKNAGARPGTGLGLSTVYTMAQQDGLGLAVETSSAGTTFRILVPIFDQVRRSDSPTDERKTPSAPSRRAA